MWVGACALRESLKMASFNKDIDFSSMRADSDVTGSSTGLYWLNPPRLCSMEVGKGLKVTPTSGSDYWRKTYEDPPASRATGNGLVTKIPPHVKRWSVSTVLSMSLVDQYDQAGLMVYVDDLHWLKAGIEYECGSPNMSSVVTNGESDWNYFPWSSVEEVVLRAELERCGSVLACKVEYYQAGVWRVLREAPIYTEQGSEVSVGIMAAAPKNEKGTPAMEVVFKNLNITTL